MSTCISRHGEFSEHTVGIEGANRFTCQHCHVFDEDAALRRIAELEAAQASDTTGQTPAIPEDFPVWRILQAISDPGRFLPRGSDSSGEPYTESIPEWSARAVRKLIGEWFAGRTVVKLPEPDDGEDTWYVGGEIDVHAYVGQPGEPLIYCGGNESLDPVLVRSLAAALLAAADLAERLASESGQDGEPNG